MAMYTRRQLNAKGKRFYTCLVMAILIIIAIALLVLYLTGNFPGMKQNENNGDNSSISDTENRGSETGNNQNPKPDTSLNDDEQQIPEEPVNTGLKVNGLFNTFGGYTSAIVANGGLNTKKDSYYWDSSLNVTIGIEDDDEVIIQSLIDGDIDFCFLTVNKMPIVCKKLADSGVDVIIPYFSDTSTGGDGIVARNDFPSMLSLQDAKIAMARNSVSTAIPLWLFNQTDLDSSAIEKIVSNFLMYDSTQEAVDAFVNGEADAVSTWDMTGALKAPNSHILFSTEEGENLVIDALVVRKEFADNHPEAVEALIDGCISVVNDVNIKNVNVSEAYDVIRESVPDFADYDDETMADVLSDSKWLGFKRNVDIFNIAPSIYSAFSNVWEQLGEETAPGYVEKLFNIGYLYKLSEKWYDEAQSDADSVIADKDDIVDKEALISKTAYVVFAPNMGDELNPDYEEKSYAALDDFIETAKILNRMVISVEGNVSLTPGNVSNEFDYSLSLLRAEFVRDYLVAHGIEKERIVVIGNGGDKPLGPNNTKEERAINRYVLLSFYTGEAE